MVYVVIKTYETGDFDWYGNGESRNETDVEGVFRNKEDAEAFILVEKGLWEEYRKLGRKNYQAKAQLAVAQNRYWGGWNYAWDIKEMILK